MLAASHDKDVLEWKAKNEEIARCLIKENENLTYPILSELIKQENAIEYEVNSINLLLINKSNM